MFCVVGTEGETGGYGAGEVSTGVESESVVRRRRAVVTRRLVPLAGGPNIAFLRSTRARVGIDSCWIKHSMWVFFVPNECYPSVTPRLLHVCDSYFPALDQYSLRSFVFPHSGHMTSTGVFCRSVVEQEKSQLPSPLLTSQYSGTLWSHPVFFCYQSLMRCWTR